ncbi:SDR family NAD(P)-dependent oxidoreductase [Pedobacter sp. LMG 31464]|uniref:SDR family NAD(P)-dependent oxidoreductase n=1 Tax=Pedobacter planticolens TaxID=2679964 RepID=A0A923DXX9_9SPHI|nr:SDR family oxidoreductase [Pedobacter planticolens]MBB2144039.1 SDR family NAD(P)-dependent oxidoreductase [Pedobacter planticolens]
MNAVITGATKGIGKAIVLKLAQQGYNLAICARTETDLQLLKNELAQYKVKVIAIKADMGNKDEIYNFCTEVKKIYPKIDVLVNNAGVFIPGSLLDEEDKTFEYQSMVNVNAPYYLSKYFGKMMREQRSGHIFNICSIASTQTIDNAGSYSVTKAAMLSLNNVLRKELSAYNVKVTAILPGSTLTASWAGTTISPDKFVQPEDIANSLYSILNLSNGVNVDEITLKPLKF